MTRVLPSRKSSQLPSGVRGLLRTHECKKVTSSDVWDQAEARSCHLESSGIPAKLPALPSPASLTLVLFKSFPCPRVCFFPEITILSARGSARHPARTAYLRRIKVLER